MTEYNEYAIKVIDNGVLVGYIPRYYSEQLSNLINMGFNYKCLINKVKKNNECDECIQVSLSIQRKKLYA